MNKLSVQCVWDAKSCVPGLISNPTSLMHKGRYRLGLLVSKYLPLIYNVMAYF